MSRADRDSLRVPPHSVDAEQAVLGGLLLLNRAWWDVVDVLTEASFYRHDHRLIWRAITAMATLRRPFDAITLGEWLDSAGHSEQVDSAYLMELGSATPSAANIRAYADIVADKARRRQLIDVGMSIANDGWSATATDSLDLIGTAQTRVAGLLADEPCDLEPLAPIMARAFERLVERSQVGARIHGLTTGIPDLDDLIGGLCPGQLVLLAARPKMGKTTLAQNIAEHVALALAKPVAIFSFEMQPDELADRMMSSIGDVDGGRVRHGDLDQADWSQIDRVMQRARAAQIHISRPRRARVEHVVAQVRRLKARMPELALVVVDYLQLMDAPGDNRAQAIGDITRALKLLASELGITVLLLSQLNRDLEKRPDKRPIPADLRDSGAIEQDADVVLFIYRDEIYNRDSRYRGTAEIIAALQRNGAPGDIRVQYRPERFRFSALPCGWEPEPLPERDDAHSTKRRGGFKRRAGSPAADARAGEDA